MARAANWQDLEVNEPINVNSEAASISEQQFYGPKKGADPIVEQEELSQVDPEQKGDESDGEETPQQEPVNIESREPNYGLRLEDGKYKLNLNPENLVMGDFKTLGMQWHLAEEAAKPKGIGHRMINDTAIVAIRDSNKSSVKITKAELAKYLHEKKLDSRSEAAIEKDIVMSTIDGAINSGVGKEKWIVIKVDRAPMDYEGFRAAAVRKWPQVDKILPKDIP